MSIYTQLTCEQRYQIEVLLKGGHAQTEIAKILAVHKSTISREISGCNRLVYRYVLESIEASRIGSSESDNRLSSSKDF